MTPDTERAALLARKATLAAKRKPIPHRLQEAITRATHKALAYAQKPRVRVKAERRV